MSLDRVLVTDCGSTTTKALLFERGSDGWRMIGRGEAPTTVEAPVADVTVGALNAFREIEEVTGIRILSTDNGSASPFLLRDNPTARDGIDIYLSTSSAGGGLQMVVAGVVRQLTGASAERAALGAGAIVLDTITADDPRPEHELVARLRHLRPDIILLTGGTDGGALHQVVALAEIIRSAAPQPRFGDTLSLPVIYAGNQAIAAEVREALGVGMNLSVVGNVRPSMEREELHPAREAIHEFFLSHVMSHSPGYGKLLTWSPQPVLPTPSAVGVMIEAYGSETKKNILCADIGGATTDVFSVIHQSGKTHYHRTVSANLGMSYSVANVLIEAGVEQIARWLPFDLSEHEIRDRLRNKMIRPTSIPHTVEDLLLEQAVCREALSLSLAHHRSLAVGLHGEKRQRGIADIFSQGGGDESLVSVSKLDMVIGSGGVLSHAPHRLDAALMMLDGFALEGFVELAVDSIFMLPHLGVLASVNRAAAAQLFERECLVRIAHAVIPVGSSTREELAQVSWRGQPLGKVRSGEVQLVKLTGDGVGELGIRPAAGVDVGRGRGVARQEEILPAPYGIILDGRPRPFGIRSEMKQQVQQSLQAIGRYG